LLSNIEVFNVLKLFTIRHNLADSLKSKFTGIVHRRYREQRETLWSLRHVSFDVFPGEAFGLSGKNGSGKSTVLRVIAGIYPPTGGQVHLPVAPTVGTMIELGVGFHPGLTGKENVFLGASIHGMNRKEIEKIYAAVMEFSELDGFMDNPVKNYSSGMHARLGFALAVNLNPDVLLVNEVVSRWRRSISREMCKADSEVSGGRKNNYFRFACC